MAHIGKRTLLIDGDTMRPSIHIEKSSGFTDLILRNMEINEVINRVPDFVMSGAIKKEDITQVSRIDNLFICYGKRSSFTQFYTIIESTNVMEFIKKVKDEFDIILFDSPPTLTTAVTSVLASKVDSVILVYEVGKIARGSLKRAVTQLNYANAKVLGVILNKMRATDLEPGTSYYYRYNYGYKYYYGKTEKSER